MRIFKAYIAVTLIFITVLISTVFSVQADSEGGVIFNDGKYLFVLKHSSNTLKAYELLPDKNGYTYNFSGNIAACCVYKDTVYTLTTGGTYDNNPILYKSKNGKSASLTLKKAAVKNPTFISVDKNGNIFVMNSNNKIRVFNSSGKKIKTFSEKVNRIIPFNSYSLAFSGKSVYRVTSSSQSLMASGFETSYFYKVSDKYIGDYNGNIYEVTDTVKKIISTNKSGAYKACEAGNYIVYYSNGEFYIYNKNGSLAGTRSYNGSVYAVSSYGSKAVVIDKSLGYKLLSQSDFFDKTENKNTSKGINLNSFKHNKKYIYVKQGTTIADFKSRIKYEGYEISFKNRRSGKLYTNTKVSFTKGNAKADYSFIVWGDVTGEGNVNSRDEGLLFKHLLGQQKLKGVFKMAANINRDKKISNADLVLLSRIYR